MVLLLALWTVAADTPLVKVRQPARVSITVLNGHRASPQSWDPAARRDQREVITKDSDAFKVRLRLTEFQ